MKICICGKGGSGKSTVVVLLAYALKRTGKDVIVLDSDESNSNLFCMLGFDKSPRLLMDMVGGKKNIQQKMIARFTSGENEPTMTVWEMEKVPSREIPSDFVIKNDNYKLVVTGKIHHSMEGCACPMGVVTREFLKKLELETDEITLVDMEAGLEHFGRGIESSVDMVVCVVEPSLESIALAAKVKSLTKTAGASFKGAILNKIISSEQRSNMLDKLNNLAVPIIGTVGFHNEFQAACLEGKPLDTSTASAEMENIVHLVLKHARETSN